MAKKLTKSRLGIILSQLKGFEQPKVRVEQYITEPEIAAEILWNAYMLGDIEGKAIIDAGCGTGILGIGALILGASKVYFIDIDKSALKILKDNINKTKSEHNIEDQSYEIHNKDIKETEIKADITIQNPPFGIKNKHADKIFLEKAVKNTKTTYSFHKSESQGFVSAFCKDNDCIIDAIWMFNFPLKQTYSFHKKRIQMINVSCFKIVRRKT